MKESAYEAMALWCVVSGFVCFGGAVTALVEWFSAVPAAYFQRRRLRKVRSMMKALNVVLSARNCLEYDYSRWASNRSRGEYTLAQHEAFSILTEAAKVLMREIQAL